MPKQVRHDSLSDVLSSQIYFGIYIVSYSTKMGIIGSAFYADKDVKNSFRIFFCHETEDVIEEGIARLGKAVREMMEG